jgi:hypothetical protein
MRTTFQVLLSIALISLIGTSYAQEDHSEFPVLTGIYLGQEPPAAKPELFAPGIVSIGEGVHGNIVFSPDFSEAAWSPNYLVDGKNVCLRMEYSDGRWEAPTAFCVREGYSHGEPFYSYSGKRLYFLSGKTGASGKTADESIWYVEKTEDGWSEPKLLTPVLDPFSMHWQFSLDREENLYFGGKSSADESAEIYFSSHEEGAYLDPVRLPGTINTDTGEFAPFISPDDSFLVFTRVVPREGAPPSTNLFVSFRDQAGNWQEAANLTEKIELPAKTPFLMMSQARMTPDGKYLLFTFFNGKGHMVYWLDAAVIRTLAD